MLTNLEILEVGNASDAECMSSFFKTVWTDGDEVIPFDLVLAAKHVGGYATIAKLDGRVVGASFGFLGTFSSHQVLHSHVTAATVPGVGYKLKLHQLSWAQERKITGITWTFDPLVRRNCVLNFEKLSAIAVSYLPNFYGTMTDSINLGDDSDRVFVYWQAGDSPRSQKKAANVSVLVNKNGAPQILIPPSSLLENNQSFWIELPADIEALRKSNLSLAREWRKSVRGALQPALDLGWLIGEMNRTRTAIMVEPPSSD